ncbi:MAG: response regulator [Candidatus Binatia bacterium]
MPDTDGLAVLAAARESGVATPIVIVTAQNTMDNAIEAMKRGAYDYIAKPFNIDEVQAVAGRALEMARLSRSTTASPTRSCASCATNSQPRTST